MNEVTIRHSAIDDLPSLRKLYSLKEISRLVGTPLFVSEGDLTRFVNGCNVNDYSLVACFGDDVIGHIIIEPDSNMLRRHVATFSLCVAPGHHNRGIGNMLMREMIFICDSYWAIKRVELTVFIDNESAIHLYRKFGFEVEGTLRSFCLRDGILADVYQMSRII